jgi:protein-disulfide isomerase
MPRLTPPPGPLSLFEMAFARALAPLAAVHLILLAGCSRPGGGDGASASSSTSAAPNADRSAVLAEVDGRGITLGEVDARAKGRMVRLRQEEYEIRRDVLDELIADRLVDAEASREGVSREVLVRREVDEKIPTPDPAQIALIYERNRDRFAGQSREQALARIRRLVVDRAKTDRRATWEGQLRQKAGVVLHLEPPRLAVKIPKGAPATGASDPRVTVVEFTDYQCPYCHQAQATIDEVLDHYKDRVRLVHLDFPLDFHPGAVPAARAARCAAEQGRFWDYHRNLMTQKGSLDESDLESRAAALHLAPGPFAKCLASDRYDEAIEADLEQGKQLGVNGTPAYLVNGRMISGARPYEDFATVIDDELRPR